MGSQVFFNDIVLPSPANKKAIILPSGVNGADFLKLKHDVSKTKWKRLKKQATNGDFSGILPLLGRDPPPLSTSNIGKESLQTKNRNGADSGLGRNKSISTEKSSQLSQDDVKTAAIDPSSAAKKEAQSKEPAPLLTNYDEFPIKAQKLPESWCAEPPPAKTFLELYDIKMLFFQKALPPSLIKKYRHLLGK